MNNLASFKYTKDTLKQGLDDLIEKHPSLGVKNFYRYTILLDPRTKETIGISFNDYSLTLEPGVLPINPPISIYGILPILEKHFEDIFDRLIWKLSFHELDKNYFLICFFKDNQLEKLSN